MGLLLRIVFAVLVNALALFVADRYVAGFMLTADGWKTFAVVALILTALNFILKPILKLLLGPLIVLTLGLGAIVVNAVILKLLDFLSPALTIQGLLSLLYATIIVSLVNLAFHFLTRSKD
jgi:putative membrane protein